MSQDEINVNWRDDPSAAALVTITQSLQGVARGQTGASPSALIRQGAAMIRSFRPTTRVAWAIQAGASAEFWGAAAHFQPRLAEQERLAREVLKAARVNVRRR